ncbi:DUF3703 domain-containing protein [Leptospira yasudae]|uniref:DUF3703 domain-containing protein n=1 Tax=Leptospira yasudae TaxID=2202201 RepID=A0ABX9LYN5_9LEPT|nr:DUF3703 domain-containing protein [Leptospira yasudae]RHX78031.1 hypothetical protein DLM77_18350 [Leptospira yasudae]TGK26289.1 DUF3703 domain-containing protein [Leptospira yasudae]TGM08466.1 DUF3703 domain-containing protein [Leptospira yasudae]
MNWKMPAAFKKAYIQEIESYRSHLRAGRNAEAWRFLERAHLIGQYYPVPHTGSHGRMLLFAVRQRDGKEFLGQLLRFAGGWLGSLFNRIPVGNPGGSNVPIFASFPIPEDLRELLADADSSGKGLSGLRKKRVGTHTN